MKSSQSTPIQRRVVRLALMASLVVCACGPEPQRASPPPPSTAPPQQVPIGQLPNVDVNALLQHTKVLSSDEYEGRAPGTKGEDLTVAYLEDQFKKVGLEPGNTDGTYIQKVPLVGITPTPAPLVFTKGGEHQTLT